MTARNLPGIRLSALVWTVGLAAAIAFAGLEIRAVGQVQKPPTPPQTTQTPPAPRQGGAAAPAATPPRTGGQGANQGASSQPGPGRGNQSRIGINAPGQRNAPWWKDEAIKKELGLRDSQLSRLDRLYDDRAKNSQLLTEELEKQTAELDRLMNDRNAGSPAIALQVARLEVPRAKLNESWFVMLYRMRQVLDPEQYQKLQTIFDRNRERGRGGQ